MESCKKRSRALRNNVVSFTRFLPHCTALDVLSTSTKAIYFIATEIMACKIYRGQKVTLTTYRNGWLKCDLFVRILSSMPALTHVCSESETMIGLVLLALESLYHYNVTPKFPTKICNIRCIKKYY